MIDYDYRMSWFERWVLRRIFKRLVLQSPQHENNITKVYELMREACEKEFTEDNCPTLDAFLMECFMRSQNRYVTMPQYDEVCKN